MGKSLRISSTSIAARSSLIVALVPLRLELPGQLRTAGANDPAAHQHVDPIRSDVVQDPLVVGDQQKSETGSPELVDPRGHGPESIDIQAGIGLVEDGDL